MPVLAVCMRIILFAAAQAFRTFHCSMRCRAAPRRVQALLRTGSPYGNAAYSQGLSKRGDGQRSPSVFRGNGLLSGDRPPTAVSSVRALGAGVDLLNRASATDRCSLLSTPLFKLPRVD